MAPESPHPFPRPEIGPRSAPCLRGSAVTAVGLDEDRLWDAETVMDGQLGPRRLGTHQDVEVGGLSRIPTVRSH